MKKCLLTLSISVVLVACSTSNESKQRANDNFDKYIQQQSIFKPLTTGDVHLPPQDNTFALPASLDKNIHQPVDIRPPSTPIAAINYSIAQFDGERALIAYPLDKKEIYSLNQVGRLLKEQGITYHQVNANQIETNWTSTGRSDDIEDMQIRYLIEQVSSKDASALAVSILQIKRDNIIFTPTKIQKQRYASDCLNKFVGELNATYRKQQGELYNAISTPISSQITTDINDRVVLSLDAGFAQSWQRLRGALSQLGFEAIEENAGRGYRELKYTPLENTEWARFGVFDPKLEKGTYSMQLLALGKQSAVVISDEEGKAIAGKQAQNIYQALQAILAR